MPCLQLQSPSLLHVLACNFRQVALVHQFIETVSKMAAFITLSLTQKDTGQAGDEEGASARIVARKESRVVYPLGFDDPEGTVALNL